MTTTSETDVIYIERVFDAPLARVWGCWTDSEQLMKWWGPKTFTSPAATMDLRVGGKYHFCMRMPDGKDLWSTGNYLEIVPMERLVFTDSFADPVGNVVSGTYYGLGDVYPAVLNVTLVFESEGEKTRFSMRHEGVPASEIPPCSQGWSESFDKLAAVLAAEN